MRTLIVISIIFVFAAACKEDESSADLVSTGISLSIISEEGEDLLNPETSNHLTEDSISLFSEEDGKLVEYALNNNSDQPKSFKIREGAPYYRMNLTPRTPESEIFPVVYIKWGRFGLDTVKAEVIRKNDGAYEVTERVWYNGEKVYDQNIEATERYFIVTKN